MPKPATKGEELSIVEIKAEIASVFIVGLSPLIVHGFSEDAEREILFPGRKKNRTERETTLKHDPRKEFRDCFYEAPEDLPTAVCVPASALNGAIRNAALRIRGATKTEVGQLVHVLGEYVPIFGLPLLDMRPVRNAGIQKTPDIRTRPFIRQWCAKFEVRFIMPITRDNMQKLCGAAGLIMGIGDGRPEKGALDFGRFQLVDEDSTSWRSIANAYSKAQQLKAIANPECYNAKTRRLLAWYDREVSTRQLEESKRGAAPAAVNGGAAARKRRSGRVEAHQ